MSAPDHCESLRDISTVNLCFAGGWGVFAAYWMVNTWWINCRYSRPLQKTLFFVILFKACSDGFTGALFATCPYSNSSRTYWNLAVNTSFTLYSTLFYTTLLLIAKGFCIMRNYLEKSEVSTLVTILVVVYLGFSAYMLQPALMSLLALLLVIVLFYLTLIYTSETLRTLEYQIASFRAHDIPQMIVPTALKWQLIYSFYQLIIAFFAIRIGHLAGNEIVFRGFNSIYYEWFLWSDIVVGVAEAGLVMAICGLVRSKDNGRLSSLEWVGNPEYRIAPMTQAKIPHSSIASIPEKTAVIVITPRPKGHTRLTGIEIGFPEE